VLVRRPGEDWHEPEVSAYPNEAELQKMIAESPSLLPEAEAPVAVATEFSCGFGKIDIVGVDLSGQVIVCECKTARNSELRRKVVGQVLAYAAGLWGMPWEAFAHRFARATGKPLVDTARALAEESGETEWDEESFRQEVTKCLAAGDFRLVLAVEAIPKELRETVQFLNVHSASGVDVLALELAYRREGELEILVPRAGGEESAPPRPPSGLPLDRETLLAGIRDQSPPAAHAAEAVLDWAEGEDRLAVRYTATTAAIETVPARRIFLRVTHHGGIQVELHTLRKHGEGWNQKDIEQLLEDLAAIDVQLDPASKWPKAPIEPLANDARRQRFLQKMEEALGTLTP
jgi:hypothetical protein